MPNKTMSIKDFNLGKFFTAKNKKLRKYIYQYDKERKLLALHDMDFNEVGTAKVVGMVQDNARKEVVTGFGIIDPMTAATEEGKFTKPIMIDFKGLIVVDRPNPKNN